MALAVLVEVVVGEVETLQLARLGPLALVVQVVGLVVEQRTIMPLVIVGVQVVQASPTWQDLSLIVVAAAAQVVVMVDRLAARQSLAAAAVVLAPERVVHQSLEALAVVVSRTLLVLLGHSQEVVVVVR
jgi:hypothetical protein